MEPRITLYYDDNVFSIMTITEENGKLYAQEEGAARFEILEIDLAEMDGLFPLYYQQAVMSGEDYLDLIPDSAGKTPDEIKALAAALLK